jgi:hypothetical protein
MDVITRSQHYQLNLQLSGTPVGIEKRSSIQLKRSVSPLHAGRTFPISINFIMIANQSARFTYERRKLGTRPVRHPFPNPRSSRPQCTQFSLVAYEDPQLCRQFALVEVRGYRISQRGPRDQEAHSALSEIPQIYPSMSVTMYVPSNRFCLACLQ